jgi:protein phosphatase
MQMTNDHSLVNELLERGEITHKEARVHPQRNMITRALGTGKHVISDIIRMDYRPGDCWLLCTDGLSNYLSSSELARILRMDIPWEDRLGSLVEAALQRGGADNITALVIPYEGGIT